MRNFGTLFKKKEPSQEQLMEKQHGMGKESDVIASALNPQDLEHEAWTQQQSMMAELTRWQQDLSPMLKELLYNLAGLSEDENGRLVKNGMIRPVCNYEFAKRVVDLIKPLDKNVMNGTWTDRQINEYMKATDAAVRQMIKEDWQYYGIRYSVADFTLICENVINATYPTFQRGLENGERKHHGQISKVIETKNIVSDKKKSGLFNSN